MNKKSFIGLLMSAIILLSLFPVMQLEAAAATVYKGGGTVTFYNESPWYMLNDTWTEGAYPAALTNGVFYVSLSDFGNAFECHTSFNPDDNSVYVEILDRKIWQALGYTAMFVDDIAYENPAPYYADNGAVMIPLQQYFSVVGDSGYFEFLEDYPPGQITLNRPATLYTLTSVEVNQAAQLITVYGKNPRGVIEPVRYMLCSTGVGSATPNGTFRLTPLGGQWYYFSRFNCWVMYCSQIVGNVCFHSIPHNSKSYASLSTSGYSMIGQRASHGCIRLFVNDAKFLHQNCSGLSVKIISGYTNATTDAIRAKILSAKPSYSDYVSSLQAGNF